MEKQFCRFIFSTLLITFFWNASSPEKIYIVPETKKKVKTVKEEVKTPISYLNEIFKLLKEAAESSEGKIILSKLNKAISLLRKEYKDKKGKITSLDCIKKAIYNVKNDKISIAVTKNIPKAILELYDDLNKDQIQKLKYFLSK